MKVYLDTVGCRLNQGEIEAYARQFRAAGHTLVPDPSQADLVVVNTCTVTAAAAADSRQKIRQAARHGAEQIIATGCWATLDPQGAEALPSVSRVVPNQDKDRLVADFLDIPLDNFDLEPVERELLPGARARTRAFIKVQDGCNNRCTFCITTLARGPGRSRSITEVLSDVRQAMQGVANASQEIVLTGVHLGSWGHDFPTRQHLSNLIEAILKDTDAPRLRLSSIEPWDLTESFFELWENPRLCRHLHMPLQSGSAATLRRMARKTTPVAFEQLTRAARAAIPGLALTTDIITGFPGEDENEFAESLAFVQQMRFSGGHAFTYSARPGTAAAHMPGQVPHADGKQRNAQVREVLSASAQAYRQQFIGQELSVLWEAGSKVGPDGWTLHGLTDNYLRVYTQGPQHLWNTISRVRITGSANDGVTGIIHTEPGAS